MQSIFSLKTKALIAAVIMMSGATMVNAEENKGKVAVLNLQAAVMSTTVAREQIKTLEANKDYSETRKKADALQKEMDKKMADAKKEGPTWTKEQQDAFRTEMDLKQKELQLNVQRLQAAEQALLRQVMNDMQPKLKKVIDELVETQKISVLLRADAALFAVPDADITATVTEKLNALK
jgi:outer membrane protein